MPSFKIKPCRFYPVRFYKDFFCQRSLLWKMCSKMLNHANKRHWDILIDVDNNQCGNYIFRYPFHNTCMFENPNTICTAGVGFKRSFMIACFIIVCFFPTLFIKFMEWYCVILGLQDCKNIRLSRYMQKLWQFDLFSDMYFEDAYPEGGSIAYHHKL